MNEKILHHIFSFCRDNRILLKWNLLSKDTTKLCELPENVHPIDLHNFTRHQRGIKRQILEQILLTSTDGLFLPSFSLLIFSFKHFETLLGSVARLLESKSARTKYFKKIAF